MSEITTPDGEVWKISKHVVQADDMWKQCAKCKAKVLWVTVANGAILATDRSGERHRHRT